MSDPGNVLNDHPVIRRLYTLGRGYGLYIPSAWARRHLKPFEPYVTLTNHPDGSFTVRPYRLRDPNPTDLGHPDILCRR